MPGPLIWIVRRESPSLLYGIEFPLVSNAMYRLSSPKTDFEQTEKKWACFTKIRWYTRFHWVSHGPKEAREGQRTNKLWRSPLLVYPGHSTPGYLNSSKRPFPYCSKALNFKVQNLSYEKEFYLQEKRIENHNIFISKASPLLSF